VADWVEHYDEVTAGEDLVAYELMKARIKEMTATAEAYKKRLVGFVDVEGETDEKGNLWVVLPDGRKLKKELRTSQVLDEDFAIPFLESRPELAETCLVWTLTVDDDALLAARYQNLITDEELSLIYPKVKTYAFVMPKK
jgi:hypothetical protein